MRWKNTGYSQRLDKNDEGGVESLTIINDAQCILYVIKYRALFFGMTLRSSDKLSIDDNFTYHRLLKGFIDVFDY